MCDYSLHGVANRPAKAGDRLVTKLFNGHTVGFADEKNPDCAVCLSVGTQLKIDDPIATRSYWPLLLQHRFPRLFGPRRHAGGVAQFKQLNLNRADVNRDALELPSGTVVFLTDLVVGQKATVLQLPATPTKDEHGHPVERDSVDAQMDEHGVTQPAPPVRSLQRSERV